VRGRAERHLEEGAGGAEGEERAPAATSTKNHRDYFSSNSEL
jgi:hypothetical protein